MKPMEFENANRWLAKPAEMLDDCGTLPVFYSVIDKTCLSCWKPTIRERLSILLFGKVWLWVWGSGGTQPPVALEGRK